MIYFLGAGPGDVDLITVKGRELLKKADVVIYAGSLVWEKHLEFCPEACERYNSAGMTLEEVIDVMTSRNNETAVIIRLHTGDPTIYGAIREQIDALKKENLPFEVIPGVSSFTAACAALEREFTVPGVTQTVIVTRIEGRTPVPELEKLELLAARQCSMAIFLSVQKIEEVVEQLKKGYQRDDVPIAIVYKASWPDQKIIRATLSTIAEKVKNEGIDRFAQILVGDFIEGDYDRSLLYDPHLTHCYRKGQP